MRSLTLLARQLSLISQLIPHITMLKVIMKEVLPSLMFLTMITKLPRMKAAWRLILLQLSLRSSSCNNPTPNRRRQRSQNLLETIGRESSKCSRDLKINLEEVQIQDQM